jgi:adhesin HecA-like repeat protein
MMNNQKGQALPVALVILAAGILLIAPFINHASSNVTGSRIYGQAITEQYSADAGIEYAIWSLLNGELDVPEFTTNNNTVNVTIEDEGEGIYKITSVASGDDESSITIEATVLITVQLSDDGFTIFEGNFILNKGDIYTGDIYVKGNVQLEQGAVINGNVYAGGNVQLEQGAVINGNVYAGGNVQLEQGAVINGDVCAGGNIQLDQGAVISGDYPLPYEECPLFAPSSIDILTWEITPQ